MKDYKNDNVIPDNEIQKRWETPQHFSRGDLSHMIYREMTEKRIIALNSALPATDMSADAGLIMSCLAVMTQDEFDRIAGEIGKYNAVVQIHEAMDQRGWQTACRNLLVKTVGLKWNQHLDKIDDAIDIDDLMKDISYAIGQYHVEVRRHVHDHAKNMSIWTATGIMYELADDLMVDLTATIASKTNDLIGPTDIDEAMVKYFYS